MHIILFLIFIQPCDMGIISPNVRSEIEAPKDQIANTCRGKMKLEYI